MVNEVQIELRESSWRTIIECIHNSRIKSQGSFWAAVQSIESQLSEATFIPKSKFKLEQK